MEENSVYPFFSIVIPVYNSESTIWSTMRTALSQTYDNYEVIVVNDGSTDRSREIINSFETNRLCVLDNSENRGRSNARNQGLKLAKGDFVVFLDSDDQLSTNYFSALSQFALLQNPLEPIIFFINYYKYNTRWHIKWSSGYPKRCFDLEDVLMANYFPISSLIFPRKLLVDRNLKFNEKLSAYEDWLFIIECCLEGAKYIHSGVKDNLTLIQIHGSNSMKRAKFMANGLESVRNILKTKLTLKQYKIFRNAFIYNRGLLLGYTGIKRYRSEIGVFLLINILYHHYKYIISRRLLI
jgi:teichuronic acid biosynthesis glycosyltransferase TuaG